MQGEARVVLKGTRVHPVDAAAPSLHAFLHRTRFVGSAALLCLAIVAAAGAWSGDRLVGSLDARGAMVDGGATQRFSTLLRTAGHAPPSTVHLVLAGLDLRETAHCEALVAADRELRASPYTVAMRSWWSAFTEREQSQDCDHLAARAREHALQAMLLRQPWYVEDVAGLDDHAELYASRWRLTMQLPPEAHQRAAALRALQAKLDALPLALVLTGEDVAQAELATQTSDAASALLTWGVLGAALLSLVAIDPLAATLVLLALLITAGAILGLLAFLPPALGAGHLPWVILAAALAPQSPIISLAGLSEHTEVADREIAALRHLSPPLARGAGCGLLCLALAALVLPLQYTRSLATLLAAVVALSTIHALVVLPLLHSATRRPPVPTSGTGGATDVSHLTGAQQRRSYHTLDVPTF